VANTRLCSIPDCRKKHYARDLCYGHYMRQRRHGDPIAGRIPPGEALDWLEAHLDHEGDDCLVWPYADDGKGYGVIKYDGRQQYAHGVICTRVHGPAPTELHEVAHSCGRGQFGCVNPKHLRWATRVENHADKLGHGTHTRGERSPAVKITEDDARQILALKGKMMQKDIAAKFGVTLGHVSNIHLGQRWGWLRDADGQGDD
jgi:hypothetical protein